MAALVSMPTCMLNTMRSFSVSPCTPLPPFPNPSRILRPNCRRSKTRPIIPSSRLWTAPHCTTLWSYRGTTLISSPSRGMRDPYSSSRTRQRVPRPHPRETRPDEESSKSMSQSVLSALFCNKKTI